MKNHNWKKGFFLLLGINLVILILILSLIFIPAEKKKKQVSIPNNENVSFFIQSNKRDVNQLINYYLMKKTAKSPINYQVKIGDEVEFYGIIPFFGENLNMKLTFEPEALPNGDLLLTQRSIAIGSLHLPVEYVLKFIEENDQLPTGVDILPDKKVIYIHMDQLKLKNGFKVKVKKFDLKKNNIAFELLIPVK